MADTKTGIDSLGFYGTSAEAEGVTVLAPSDNLGGFRAGSEVPEMAYLVENPIAPLKIERVFGGVGLGAASVFAPDVNSAQLTAPGGVAGASVAISEGETKLLVGDDTDHAVRVTREVYDQDLKGTMTVRGMALLEAPFAFGIVENAERVSGSTKYRAFMLYAHGAANLTSLKFWLDDDGHAGVQYALALEAPSSRAIQEIADEDTAPTGLTWNTGTTSGTGLSLGSLNSGAVYGLWVRRVISAGTTVATFLEIGINYEFIAGGVTYTGKLRGAIRIANTALDRYELFEGIDADPDFDAAAAATSASLPFTRALTPPGSGEREFRHAVIRSNRFGMKSVNRYLRSTVIDNLGALVTPAPSAPRDVTLTDAGGGYVTVTARYDWIADATPADRFSVRYRGDGVDPVVGVDAATLYALVNDTTSGTKVKRFTATLGPFAKGANVHVLVRMHRVSDSKESANTTTSEIDVGTIVLTGPRRRLLTRGYGQAWPQTAQSPLNTETVIDAGNNIKWVQTEGATELWAEGSLILRARFDGAVSNNRGIWVTYDFIEEEISGAAGAEPVEVVSWTGGDKRIAFTVEGQRRLMIDVTNQQIKCKKLREVPSAVRFGRSGTPLVQLDAWHALLQVFDRHVDDYETVASLTGDGTLALRVPWRQRSTVGEFE